MGFEKKTPKVLENCLQLKQCFQSHETSQMKMRYPPASESYLSSKTGYMHVSSISYLYIIRCYRWRIYIIMPYIFHWKNVNHWLCILSMPFIWQSIHLILLLHPPWWSQVFAQGIYPHAAIHRAPWGVWHALKCRHCKPDGRKQDAVRLPALPAAPGHQSHCFGGEAQ